VRTQDLICRLGGDEFVLILRGCIRYDANCMIAGLYEAIADLSFYWEDACFNVSASIGLAHIGESVTNKTDLLKAADAACYIAKRQGRNQVVAHEGASLA
jgi:diguanylate cyclase (GGDEF)-like protein